MNAIEIKDVHKSFKIYYDKGSTLKEKVLFKNRNRHEVHQVLNGVTFSVKQGEVVGLVGENGCGKSTLLKLMTRIIYPDKGSIEVNGKVSSLLELGAGFHPDMSGRENIYTNASIFGLSKKEIDSRIDEIIAFSELGEFIDNPVRTYSSGMYMRLAFSVAINVDADILLVDEILAVGDAAFQAKCFNKMQEIKKQGTTIVIVSHDLGSIERLCDRSVWINKGKIIRDGRPKEISGEYLNAIMFKDENSSETEDITEEAVVQDELAVVENMNEPIERENLKRWGNRDIVIKNIRLLNSQNKVIKKVHTGEEITIEIEFQKNKQIQEFVIGIGINSAAGITVYGTNTDIDKKSFKHDNEQGIIRCRIPECNLIQGEYYLDIAVHTVEGIPYDYWCEALSFNVYSEIGDVGFARINHQWKIDDILL